MYSLSAIVPFYNEERYLEESVTKLIQTNLFDEIILLMITQPTIVQKLLMGLRKIMKLLNYIRKIKMKERVVQ